jgi:hypothetical protein
VSISGDIIAVGAATTGDYNSGVVYVYVRNETAWVQQTVLERIGHVGNALGQVVSVSSDYIIVGAFFETSGGYGYDNCTDENPIDYSGAVYVFETTSWSLVACIKSPNPQYYAQFGGSVDVYDDTYVIGNHYNSEQPGAFVYQGTTGIAGTTGTTSAVGTGLW